MATAARRAAIAGVASVGVALALAACGGGGGEADQTADYGEILRGLERSALAGRKYDAAARARGLAPGERVVALSFCRLTWQVPVNHEWYKLAQHAYIVARIKATAEGETHGWQADAVARALSELRSTIDLSALNHKLIPAYRRACFG